MICCMFLLSLDFVTTHSTKVQEHNMKGPWSKTNWVALGDSYHPTELFLELLWRFDPFPCVQAFEILKHFITTNKSPFCSF